MADHEADQAGHVADAQFTHQVGPMVFGGLDADGHEIAVDGVPPTKGIGNPAPFPVTLPTLTVPQFRTP